jgi:hypothetical protein
MRKFSKTCQRMWFILNSHSVSKLDRRILPAFWILYFMCSAIRSNIGLAQTMNIKEGHDLASELSLTPKQVSTCPRISSCRGLVRMHG